MQNTTHAVMAQRHETAQSPDDFPTPPWATRALIEHVVGKAGLETMSCLEPACGRGHMSRTLEEYFGSVASSDAFHYGYGQIRDFLSCPVERALSRLGHHQSAVQIGGGVRQSSTAHRRSRACSWRASSVPRQRSTSRRSGQRRNALLACATSSAASERTW